MSSPDTLYATDEDISLRAASDFALLCPQDQVVVSASDGVFTAADRWALRSGSVDFQARGVSPGQVVQLLRPSTAFRPPGDSCVVDRVDAGGIYLIHEPADTFRFRSRKLA